MSNDYILYSVLFWAHERQPWIASHSHGLLLFLLFSSFFHRLLSICTPFHFNFKTSCCCCAHIRHGCDERRAQHAVHSSSHIFNYNWCLLLLFEQRIRTHSTWTLPFWANAKALDSVNRGKLVRLGLLIEITIKHSCRLPLYKWIAAFSMCNKLTNFNGKWKSRNENRTQIPWH